MVIILVFFCVRKAWMIFVTSRQQIINFSLLEMCFPCLTINLTPRLFWISRIFLFGGSNVIKTNEVWRWRMISGIIFGSGVNETGKFFSFARQRSIWKLVWKPSPIKQHASLKNSTQIFHMNHTKKSSLKNFSLLICSRSNFTLDKNSQIDSRSWVIRITQIQSLSRTHFSLLPKMSLG